MREQARNLATWFGKIRVFIREKIFEIYDDTDANLARRKALLLGQARKLHINKPKGIEVYSPLMIMLICMAEEQETDVNEEYMLSALIDLSRAHTSINEVAAQGNLLRLDITSASGLFYYELSNQLGNSGIIPEIPTTLNEENREDASNKTFTVGMRYLLAVVHEYYIEKYSSGQPKKEDELGRAGHRVHCALSPE